MAKFISPNFHCLVSSYNKGLSGVVLEGGSRSTKTWSVIDFIFWLCANNEKLSINIIKEVYNDFKTTLYEDFDRKLTGFVEHPFGRVQDIHTFNLLGNHIKFLGADKDFDGKTCDVFWMNEPLKIDKFVFDNQEQRCRKFFILDYNPKVTTHWIYDKVIPRPDVAFLKTTIFDNPFVSYNEKRKILSYDPANPENVANGTADDYMWSVYGIGKRAAMEGLIYKDVTYVDTFPTDCEFVTHGEDFGYTISDTAICKVGFKDNDLFAELLFYAPTGKLGELLEANKAHLSNKEIVWCDSADPNYISHLRNYGINAIKVIKPEIKFSINLVNQFKIHIIRNDFVVHAKNEIENYKWQVLSGVTLPIPIGKSHFLDALRYAVIMSNRLGATIREKIKQREQK